jgi:uncharacterized protein YbjT (DUF2867 family)
MIVVSGATGNVGRALVRMLDEAGEKVTAVSRGIMPVDLPAGVRHVRADLSEPAGLPVEADAFFLLVSGAGAHVDPAAVLGALRAGAVRRVVTLSSQAAGRPSHAPLRAIEQAAERSGLAWTHLRPAGFATNALAWAPAIRATRTAAAPFAGVALPVIDPRDIAAAAAVVLRGDGHAGRTYELTGPEPITPREQVRQIAEALGEPVRFAELTRAEAREQMLTFMPEPVADGTLAVLGEPTEAERRVSPDTGRLLGREPGTFAAWAKRTVTAFR